MAWGLPGITIRKGVHAKEFLKDASGAAWIVKSGALDEPFPPKHSALMERGRRIAFPLNEVLSAIFFRTAGLATNEFALGFRDMHVCATGRVERLLVSYHKMQRAVPRCDKASFVLTPRYVEDLFCMMCVDVIMGQRDHKIHNYMVTDDDHLLPVDNSDCMIASWLSTNLGFENFENLVSPEPAVEPWSRDLKSRVIARLGHLTAQNVDSAFDALPPECVELHDKNIEPGWYVAGTMGSKRDRFVANLQVFRAWASS